MVEVEGSEFKTSLVKYRPRTSTQIAAWDSLKKKQLVILAGSAGTGKTEMAVARASELLLSGKVKNLYISRPYKHLGKDYGAIRGGDSEKLLPFVLPLLMKLKKYCGSDFMRENFTMGGFDDLFSDKTGVSIMPVEKIQGMSFCDSDLVIVDEAQNCEVSQIKSLVTRLEKGCSMILCGDELQSAVNGENGLNHLLGLWESSKEDLSRFQSVFKFPAEDCQRTGVSSVYTRIFEEEGAWNESKKVEKKVEPDSLVHKNDEGVQGHLREE